MQTEKGRGLFAQKWYICTLMSERKPISLLELQTLIKRRMDEALPLPFWVTAEISELKVNYSGHCYLELVEKGGTNQVPRAKVSAVIWRSTFGALRSYFHSATGNELAEGMKVLVRVTVNYHELYGLSLCINDIDPLYTLGDMERQRQQTILRLQEEGVFDMNRALELPAVVQRVAVVSSRNAAGYQDFMNELAAGGYHFELTLFDAVMQGHATEESVIGALERIGESVEQFDAVVIIRGGGSQSDLAAFDSYRLSCHIAQFPLPVITGIGHDKDQSVADLVAGVSLKTPTAVAAWLVGGLADFDAYLVELGDRLVQSAVDYLDGQKRRVQGAALLLSRASGSLTRSLEVRLERLAGEVVRAQGNVLMRQGGRIDALRAALRERTAARLARENARLELAEGLARSRRPDNILALGFAIVRAGGRAVTDSAALRADDMLDITLARGRVTANVKSTEDGKE